MYLPDCENVTALTGSPIKRKNMANTPAMRSANCGVGRVAQSNRKLLCKANQQDG
jgi:hypothetical protein